MVPEKFLYCFYKRSSSCADVVSMAYSPQAGMLYVATSVISDPQPLHHNQG
jgi:hypothetical protein